MAEARTIGRLTALNLVNTGLALLNTVVVAYYFGTGRSVEIYLAAAGLYASVVSLAQTGQVSEILLPTYHHLRERHGAEVAFQAYTALINRLLAVLLMLCAGCWILAPVLAAWRVPGFGSTDIAMVADMFRWILPLVLLQLAAELFKTLANAERLFGTPEIVSGAARTLSLLALVALAGHVGPWALVVALWCAVLMEIAGILWLLRRCHYAYGARLRLPAAAADVALFAKLIATLPYVVLTQLYLFVLDAGLSRLAQGSFAVFRYASTIASRSQGVFLRPVSVTFFTEFSESRARATGAGTALTDQAMARVLAISALVATGVLCGAGPVLRGLWEGEQFPAEQIDALVWLLGGLYVLLPVVGSATILRKVAVSMGQVQGAYLALAVVQVLSAILAWQVVPVAGLVGALLVSAFNLVGFCIAPLVALRLSGQSMDFRYPFGRAWRWLLAAATGVLVAGFAQQVFPLGGTSIAGRLIYLLTGGALAAIGMAVAFGLSWVLRVPESRLLASRVFRALTP